MSGFLCFVPRARRSKARHGYENLQNRLQTAFIVAERHPESNKCTAAQIIKSEPWQDYTADFTEAVCIILEGDTINAEEPNEKHVMVRGGFYLNCILL